MLRVVLLFDLKINFMYILIDLYL